MNNRALIGLSAAAMSALVATAVGCGEPQQKTYTPAEEPAATVEAPATTEAETTETEAAEPEATEAEKAEETTEAEGDKAEEAAPAEETTEAEAEAEKTDGAPVSDAAYTDGEYTAEGKGIGGTVPVTVTVKDGKIAEVTVGDNSETQGIGSKAIEQLPAKIVEANGLEGVDAVSGATVTSKAIFSAVDEALAQAQGGAEAAEQSEEAAPAADDAKAEETAEPAAEEKADEKAEPAADEKAEEAAPAAEAGALTDGSYTAEGKGIGGKVPVTVEVKDGKVATVTVGDNSETQGIGSKAIEQLPDAIVAANGTEGVDAVSGATVTSKAIFTAVEDCLEQAKGGAAEQAAPGEDAKADEKAEPAAEEKAEDAKADEKAEEAAPAAEAGALTDGSYTAEGKGIGGKVPVTVEVKDGKVATVTVGDNSETQGIGSKAIEQLPDAIVAANGTEGVDAVSGATVTSKAIFTAVEDCLEQAKGGAAEQAAPGEDAKADEKAEPAAEEKAADTKDAKADEKADEKAEEPAAEEKAEDAKADEKAAPAEEAAPAAEAGALTDGSYTAEGKGIGGKVPVTVEVKDGKVATVTVGDNSETQGIGSKAIEQLPEAIVAANGTEGVDAVSGATVTSKAIFSAVDEALEQAKGGAAAEQAAPAEADKAEEPAAEEKADDKAADTKDAKADDKADKAEDAKADEKAEPAAEEKADEKADTKDEKAADTKDAKTDDKAADAKDEKAEDAKADEKDAKDAKDDKDDKAAEGYADGDYTAEGKGIGGKVPVTVTVKDGKVSDVKVGDNSETQGIGSKAIEQLPAKIVEANGTEGVDAVSGATVTSKAIFSAVEDCLKQAAPAADAKADKAEAGALKDGDYTAEGKGIGGKVPVTVTVKDGKIATVTVGDNSETQGIGSKAIEKLPEAIVAANGTEGVDAVSGATVTSKAIFSAVEDCLEQAK